MVIAVIKRPQRAAPKFFPPAEKGQNFPLRRTLTLYCIYCILSIAKTQYLVLKNVIELFGTDVQKRRPKKRESRMAPQRAPQAVRRAGRRNGRKSSCSAPLFRRNRNQYTLSSAAKSSTATQYIVCFFITNAKWRQSAVLAQSRRVLPYFVPIVENFLQLHPFGRRPPILIAYTQ